MTGDPSLRTELPATVWGSLGTTALSLRMAEIGGWSTRVLEAGQGEPVVLMHGTGGHLEAFARNIPALSQRYRTIAYDFPAHGYSSLADRDVEIPHYEEHLLLLLDNFGIQRAHLMGESLGGWVAAKFAAHHPDRVARVILNTPGGRTADPVVMARIHTLTEAAVDDPTPEQVRARLEWLMANPGSVTDELVAIRRAIYSRPGFRDSIRHVLSSITAPTLVLWASDDPSAPVTVGWEMAERIPNATFDLIEQAGHWPQWEQPDSYNALVLGFLGEELTGRTGA
jgi:2-hydroxy-6-oxonona-2,4-dienedioate hydrolase